MEALGLHKMALSLIGSSQNLFKNVGIAFVATLIATIISIVITVPLGKV